MAQQRNYNYKNIEYIVWDTIEVHGRFQSDRNFFNEYMRDKMGTFEAVGVDEAGANAAGETGHQWTTVNTKYLLELYREKKGRFRDPKIKKKVLWMEIRRDMMNAGYTEVTEEALDRKMRNLKKTYRSIKDNNSKTSSGRGRITWEYFDFFEDIFSDDVTINPGYTISSLRNASVSSRLSCSNDLTISSHENSPPLVEVDRDQNNSLRSPSTPRISKRRRNRISNRENIERERIAAVRSIAEKMEEHNNIQRERNQILLKLLEKP